LLGYLLRRMLFALLLVYGVASASLVLSRLAPGDYATESLGFGARPEALADARARYGLDRPFAAHYLDWIRGTLRFDFGRSLAYDRPVGEMVRGRVVNTALLSLSALALATCLGLPLGVISATRDGGLLSGAIRAGSLVLLSTPPLLTSLVLVFVAARTGWLPVSGVQTSAAATAPASFAATTLDLLRHMVVPVLALGLPLSAQIERLQSQATRAVVGQRFVLAAGARGIPPTRLVWRHALKASLGQVVSMYGVIAGTVLSGSFAVEIVTAWPGLGRLTLDALRTRDVFLAAGCAAAAATCLAVATLVADLALVLVDPRVSE
jgi:ABC-type dipeptide/oligopeptide/nickel transport system permease component